MGSACFSSDCTGTAYVGFAKCGGESHPEVEREVFWISSSSPSGLQQSVISIRATLTPKADATAVIAARSCRGSCSVLWTFIPQILFPPNRNRLAAMRGVGVKVPMTWWARPEGYLSRRPHWQQNVQVTPGRTLHISVLRSLRVWSKPGNVNYIVIGFLWCVMDLS